MRKFLRLAVAAMVLMIIPASAIYAAPPDYGTVEGNTWTFSYSLLDFSYSITPVPERRELENISIFSLTQGSVLTVSGTGIEVEISAITEFDYSEMAEHAISAPIFTGTTYKFENPGQYLVYFKQGESYRASIDLEVN